jgi:hypothetical protein
MSVRDEAMLNHGKRFCEPCGKSMRFPSRAILNRTDSEGVSQMPVQRLFGERPQDPEPTRMPVWAIASWVFALALGVVFWTLLFYAAAFIIWHV